MFYDYFKYYAGLRHVLSQLSFLGMILVNDVKCFPFYFPTFNFLHSIFVTNTHVYRFLIFSAEVFCVTVYFFFFNKYRGFVLQMYTISYPLTHILVLLPLQMLLIFVNNMDQKTSIVVQK